LLYVQSDRLYAQKLNLRRATREGEPERIVDGVSTNLETRHARFSVSRNGVLVWTAGRSTLSQPTWFDRKGNVLGTAGPPGLPQVLRLSRDEKNLLAYTVTDHARYSIVEVNHSGYVPLPGITRPPLWMPNGSGILYTKVEGGSSRVLERSEDGGAAKELARVTGMNILHDVSPDGRVLLYKSGMKLFAVRLDGAPDIAQPQEVAETVNGRFSPDGRWIVYSAAGESDRQREVYARPFLPPDSAPSSHRPAAPAPSGAPTARKSFI
jgi:hypothetical protein